ncbi:MAG: serine/threonine transporter SstT [Victivallales bacterium]|nr:serine/threonine transporter SstT [Victivallales bacterium]
MTKSRFSINGLSLPQRILIGLVIGTILGLAFPQASWIGILGSLFVGGLKAVAPLLVFLLVIASLARSQAGFDRRFGFVIFEYMLSTFLAAIVAVVASFLFPVSIALDVKQAVESAAPGGLRDILEKQLLGMVANPMQAIAEANYISILFWAILIGVLAKKFASPETHRMLNDLSGIMGQVVVWIINFAPIGILGLVFHSVSTSGMGIFLTYGKLLLVLVGCMLGTGLVINPLIVFFCLRRNPYPLVLRCLRESGFTAFFTRSSAANIPVNMRLCERLGLDKDFYSVSIPLGATINMDGAAVTITVMTLAAANTMGIEMTIGKALLLSVLASVAACGASGVAGGSLLLIPMACSIFGIPAEAAMQVVGVGFIIGVVQDSLETALNSSGDAIFTACAEYVHWRKIGKSLPVFLGGTTPTEIK